MDSIQLGIVGCGGMGTRHLHGLREYAEIVKAGYGGAPLRLAAVCDPNEANATLLAETAAAELGERPRVFHKLEALLSEAPEVTAFDVTTEPRLHHDITCQLLRAGKD